MKKVMANILWESFNGLRSIGYAVWVGGGLVALLMGLAVAMVIIFTIIVGGAGLCLVGWWHIVVGNAPWYFGIPSMIGITAIYVTLAGLTARVACKMFS